MPFQGMESEEALRALADVLPDGLFTTDADGRVTFWNAAAERITGWPREEALGRSCSLLAGDAVNGCKCGGGPTRCGMVERGYSSRCCTLRTKDGRHVLLVKKAVPLYDADRRLVGALETFTDVGTAPVETPRVGCESGEPERCLGIVGASAAMREVSRMISLFARSDSNVLIHGESGTGKQRIAEAIHASSRRARHPFVRVSCTASTDDALEAELFGARGAAGRIEQAGEGAVLLDGIGELSLRVQAKLLRAVEERVIESDARERVPLRARMFCTAHEDVRQVVAAGKFRADLFFRLSTLTLEVPPLRARHGDVCALARALLGCDGASGAHLPRLTPDALRALEGYAWPGNVRELHNVLEHALLRAGDGQIAPEHLPAHVTGARAVRPPRRLDATRDAIRDALAASRGNRAEAARRLGISRVTLWKRIKALGLGEPRLDEG